MPDFNVSTSTFTVADYCKMFEKGEILVNRDYQRSDQVWPPAARSFLIETVLLGFPMPKLSLHQRTDLKSRKTTKEIVDGQQRSQAIYDFYSNSLKLGRLTELTNLKGRRYQELDEENQAAFLSYPIAVDLFTGATEEEIREVFRRMNSYTVPLNPEEQRHAVYQGEMKWFIYHLSRKYGELLRKVGAFAEKGLVRMADAKLYAEVIHALLHGILTTKKDQLDHLYDDHEDRFTQAPDVRQRFERSLDLVVQIPGIHGGELMKPHQLYSLLLALMHVERPVPSLRNLVKAKKGQTVSPKRAQEALNELASVLKSKTRPPRKFKRFVEAGSDRTNVKAQREIRFRTYCAAVRGD